MTHLSRERVFEELSKALLKADAPDAFFRTLSELNHLKEFFPEIACLIGIPQNPVYHPEGDVFEHTMLTLNAAATLRDQAKEPLNFMLAALLHDLGKANSTELTDGRITSYRHPETGVPLAEKQLKRLTTNTRTISYVKNMALLHMRPNMLAAYQSKKVKTRHLFDESLCPEDLMLLSKADALGKKDRPYNEEHWKYLSDRLKDYYDCVNRPMVTGEDLVRAGYQPGKSMGQLLKIARDMHFSGIEKNRALKQLTKEYPPEEK